MYWHTQSFQSVSRSGLRGLQVSLCHKVSRSRLWFGRQQLLIPMTFLTFFFIFKIKFSSQYIASGDSFISIQLDSTVFNVLRFVNGSVCEHIKLQFQYMFYRLCNSDVSEQLLHFQPGILIPQETEYFFTFVASAC